MAKEVRVRLNNLERVRARTDAVVRPSITELSAFLIKSLQDEMPERSGNMKNNVRVELAERTRFTYATRVIIDTPYALAVWKGLDPNEYSVAPNTQPAMIFDIDDWPQYDGRFGNIRIFKFYIRLRNNIPPNDFVERAIMQIDEKAKFIFRKNIKLQFRS